MTPREILIAALTEAAEIEHGITCQYLFAAFSLKTHPEEGGVDWPALEQIRGWKAEILRVARQEMAHHGLLCNLLLVLGGAPHFRRSHFPHPVRYCPPYSTFELLPFSVEALDRFTCYERLHAPAPAEGGRAAQAGIGALYQLIRGGLLTAAERDPDLFIGPKEHQISNAELRIRPGQFDVDLATVSDLRSALSLLDQILEHDHHERFLAIRRELDALTREDPAFEPARPVAKNPSLRPRRGPGDPTTSIRHPVTRAAAELFNAAYEVMVLMLTRLYGRSNETAAEVDGLLRIAFFPLMTAVIRPLGEVLTQMPMEDGSSATAGPPFEFLFGRDLQPYKRGAWLLLHERLVDMARLGERLAAAVAGTSEPWARRVQARLGFLSENLERLAAGFEQTMGLRRARGEG
jgi:hypothetical protein